jgi:hypothetical protein
VVDELWFFFFFFFFFLTTPQIHTDLQCNTQTNLCDEMECGPTVFVGTTNNSCFASASYAACGDLTWSGPRPNAQPCPVAIGGAPKSQCVEIAFESLFDEEVTLSSLGSLVTVKLRYLKPGEVAQFDKTGVWTQQQIEASGNLTFRLDFDGPEGTGQTSLRWFARPCQPTTAGPVATQPNDSPATSNNIANSPATTVAASGAPVATNGAAPRRSLLLAAGSLAAVALLLTPMQ